MKRVHTGLRALVRPDVIFFLVSTLVVVAGIAVLNDPKIAALNDNDKKCRALLIIDRSGSTEDFAGPGKSMSTLKAYTKSLLGSGGINNSKIDLAFWAFSGNDNRWYGGDYNRPSFGFVPTTAPNSNFNAAVDNLRSEGSTFYNWALGYDNGPSDPRGSSHRNPNLTGIGDWADVIVFTTDGAPSPDGDYNDRLPSASAARGIYETFYRNYHPNTYSRTIVGAVIKGEDTIKGGPNISSDQKKEQLLSVVVNGSQSDPNDNVFVVEKNYSNFTERIKTLVHKACNYTLTPTVNVPSHVGPGKPITVKGTIKKDSISRPSEKTNWRITRIDYAPGKKWSDLDNKPVTGKKNPCNAIADHAFMSGGNPINCNPGIMYGTGEIFRNPTTNKNINQPMPTALGSIVCYFLSVQPPNFDAQPSDWKHSPLQCTEVRHSPYFQVLGGDIYSRDIISAFFDTGTKIGAGSQLAALAAANINGFTSAQGRTANTPPFKYLSFSNTTGNATFGGNSGNMGYSAQTVAPPASLPASNLIVRGYRDTNAVTDPTGPVQIVKGHIYITTDMTTEIKAPDTFSIDNIPFFRLLATGNIYIAAGVTRVDAILQANGTVYTCAVSDGSGGLKVPSTEEVAKFCKNPLRINGAITASKIKLLRSSGTYDYDASLAYPAEIFDYTPLTWLQVLSGVGLTGGVAPYDAYTSLPPIL